MVTPLLVVILPIGQNPRQQKKNEPSDVKENQSEVSNKNKTE